MRLNGSREKPRSLLLFFGYTMSLTEAFLETESDTEEDENEEEDDQVRVHTLLEALESTRLVEEPG